MSLWGGSRGDRTAPGPGPTCGSAGEVRGMGLETAVLGGPTPALTTVMVSISRSANKVHLHFRSVHYTASWEYMFSALKS